MSLRASLRWSTINAFCIIIIYNIIILRLIVLHVAFSSE